MFEQRIAQDVFAYQGSQLLGSLFQVGATAKPGHDLDEIANARSTSEIDRLAADGPTDAELARARNTHLADFYKGLDHLQTRADLLNHYQHVLGDPDGVASRRRALPAGDAAPRCATPSRARSPRNRPATCATRPPEAPVSRLERSTTPAVDGGGARPSARCPPSRCRARTRFALVERAARW